MTIHNEHANIAINIDDIYYQWDDFKDKSVRNVDEKHAIEYLKKILRIEELATKISRLILYTTVNLHEFLGI